MRRSFRQKTATMGSALLVAALLMLATAWLAACGGGDEGTATETPTGVTVAGKTVTADESLAAAVPQAVKNAGVLRVATDIPYPPFEMWADEGSGQATGFDYDLGRALAAKLDLDFTFDDIVFDSLIPALQADKADLILAAMVDNAERQKTVDFIDYATVGSVLLTRKGNPEGLTTLESLDGKTCAAQSGTIQAQMLEKLAKKIDLQVLTFPKDSDALLAVKSGKAAADFMQLPNAAYTVETTGGEYEIVVDPDNPGGYMPSIIGAAILKDNAELRDVIQKALQALMDDGTYAAILAEYGLENSAVESAEINQGK